MKNQLGYLKPLINFMLLGLLLMTVSRLVLFFLHYDRVVQVDNYLNIFSLGLRIDLIVMCYLSFLPALLISFTPKNAEKIVTWILMIYASIFVFLIFLVEISTPEFISEYDTRPNKLYLEYLIYPKEVIGTLFKAKLVVMIISLVLLAGLIVGLVKLAPRLFTFQASSYKYRLILFPFIAFFLFWGARGSLTTRRPINASNSVFCTDQLVNVLGVNSFYTVLYAAYSLKNEANPIKLYGFMEKEEAYARVKKYTNIGAEDFIEEENNPFLHIQYPDSVRERPYNVVIFLQESLGAEYVGALGGLPLTPNFDSLATRGLLFTNLYCTGTRSVRGIEAVSTGFLPSPSESVVKLPNSQTGFFSLASLLKEKGYSTSFVYGGMANFDNMASFLGGNGFDAIIDEPVFDKQLGKDHALKGVWGYSDEDLVVVANNYFKSLGDKPFFSLMFSTSNHEPFEYPDGRIEPYESPKNTVHNAMKYADFAIGKFFEMAQKEEYFKNTIFLIIADHNTRTQGASLVPVDKFHIPALIVAPQFDKREVYKKLSSQIDIPPTVLYLTGLEVETPMVGRNLMTLSDSAVGRSIMQFHDVNAFRVGDEVVISQPRQKPLQFKVVSDNNLVPMALNDTLAADALAHVLAANYLYKDRSYRLRTK